jgi:hypothetical protein
MTSPAFEAFLARLYTDENARSAFLIDPAATARQAGLTVAECDELAKIDRIGLELAAASFARKREKRRRAVE